MDSSDIIDDQMDHFKNSLVLELNTNEHYNLELTTIEQQSPIIERELLNTEYELENFKSRLAMSETVSAVTQSVLDTIRSEYNLPDDDLSNDERPCQFKLEDYVEEEAYNHEINQQLSSSNENLTLNISHQAEEVEQMLQDDSELTFASSMAEISKVMMVQNLDDEEHLEETIQQQQHQKNTTYQFFNSSSSTDEDEDLIENISKPLPEIHRCDNSSDENSFHQHQRLMSGMHKTNSDNFLEIPHPNTIANTESREYLLDPEDEIAAISVKATAPIEANLVIQEFLKLESKNLNDLTDASGLDSSDYDCEAMSNTRRKSEHIETVIGIESTNLLLSTSSSSAESKNSSCNSLNLHAVGAVKTSKSLNFIESLVVPSSSNDLGDAENLGDVPRSVCNFFDRRVTSSDEPSLDELNQILDNDENDIEEKTALATALMFSATVQSDYEMKEIVVREPLTMVTTSSNESVVVNEEYDDTEDQNALRLKIGGAVIDDFIGEEKEEDEFVIDDKTFLLVSSDEVSPVVERKVTFDENDDEFEMVNMVEEAMTIVKSTLEKSVGLVSEVAAESAEEDEGRQGRKLVARIIEEAKVVCEENVHACDESVEVDYNGDSRRLVASIIEKARLVCESNAEQMLLAESRSLVEKVVEKAKLKVDGSEESKKREGCSEGFKEVNKKNDESDDSDDEDGFGGKPSVVVGDVVSQNQGIVCTGNQFSVDSEQKNASIPGDVEKVCDEVIEEVCGESVVLPDLSGFLCSDKTENLVDLVVDRAALDKEVDTNSDEPETASVLINQAFSQELSVAEKNDSDNLSVEAKIDEDLVTNYVNEIINISKSLVSEDKDLSIVMPSSMLNIDDRSYTEGVVLVNNLVLDTYLTQSSGSEETVIKAVKVDQTEDIFTNEKMDMSESGLKEVPLFEKNLVSEYAGEIIKTSSSIASSGLEIDSESVVETDIEPVSSYEINKELQNEGVDIINILTDFFIKSETDSTDTDSKPESNNQHEAEAELNSLKQSLNELVEEITEPATYVLNDIRITESGMSQKDSEGLEKSLVTEFVGEIIENSLIFVSDGNFSESKELNITHDLVDGSNLKTPEDQYLGHEDVDSKIVNDFVGEIIKKSSSIVTEVITVKPLNSTTEIAKVIPPQENAVENFNAHLDTTGNTSFYSTLEYEQTNVEAPPQAYFSPCLTSSFISESGNLPEQSNLLTSFDLADTTLNQNSTIESDDQDDDLSNKTLDIDTTTNSNNQSVSSSCTFHTAAESVSKASLKDPRSKRSSTSNSYFTAVEGTVNTSNQSRSFTMSDSSFNAQDRSLYSSTYSNNNSEFNTCDEISSGDLSSNNSTLAELSNDDLDQHPESLGKLNVESFLNIGKVVVDNTSTGGESAGSTLTDRSKEDEDLKVKKSKLNLVLKTEDLNHFSPESPSPVEPNSTRRFQQNQVGKRSLADTGETDSVTSSVLEFENLEMQCSSSESFEEQEGIYQELNEAEQEDSFERKANFEICHDLNTIYESNDDLSLTNQELETENSKQETEESKESPTSSNLSKANLASSQSLARSLSKLSPINDLLSRSSSSNSVKSNDSFETEIKTSVKIDESSFFTRNKPSMQTQPGLNSQLLSTNTPSPSTPSTTFLHPSQNDSGNISQIQSPQSNNSEPDSEMTTSLIANVCLVKQPTISKRDLVNRSKEELKFMSELKRSMAKEGSSTGQRRLTSQNHSTNSSSRQSRTSSSTSSASSSSLSLYDRSNVIQVLGQKKNSAPNANTMSAESLPSFRKQASQAEAKKSTQGVNLVTSTSFTGNSVDVKDAVNLNDKKQTTSSPNIAAGHHSANCYCHKHVQKVNSNSSNEIKAILSNDNIKGNELI